MKRHFLVVALVMGGLALSGCVSGKPKHDTYTDKNGTVQVIESDREACEHSCNDEFSRCGDSDASRRSIDSTNGLFGAGAACNRSLKSCLSQCKGR